MVSGVEPPSPDPEKGEGTLTFVDLTLSTAVLLLELLLKKNLSEAKLHHLYLIFLQ